MEEKTSSFLSSEGEGIRRFLDECIRRADPDTEVSDSKMKDLVDLYLGTTISCDPGTGTGLTSILPQILKEVHPHSRRSIKQCLLDATTPMPVLREIKEHFKGIAVRGCGEADRRVATALYYGAIASARVFHHRPITSYPNAEQAKAIDKLLDRPWLDPDLRSLFEQAQKVLRE